MGKKARCQGCGRNVTEGTKCLQCGKKFCHECDTSHLFDCAGEHFDLRGDA